MISYTFTYDGESYADERSHREADQAAGRPHPDGRRAGRQHGQGGATPEHISAEYFEIDCRPGVRPRRSTPRSPPPGNCADRLWASTARGWSSRFRRTATDGKENRVSRRS